MKAWDWNNVILIVGAVILLTLAFTTCFNWLEHKESEVQYVRNSLASPDVP